MDSICLCVFMNSSKFGAGNFSKPTNGSNTQNQQTEATHETNKRKQHTRNQQTEATHTKPTNGSNICGTDWRPRLREARETYLVSPPCWTKQVLLREGASYGGIKYTHAWPRLREARETYLVSPPCWTKQVLLREGASYGGIKYTHASLRFCVGTVLVSARCLLREARETSGAMLPTDPQSLPKS